jgi:cell fate (sporulation/competence/biofilm development) regulator YlbF (YheA/YmcA/DUF963 family)
MEVLPILNLPTTHEKVEQAAVKLGDLLREQPLYQTYMRSIMDLEKDPQVLELSTQIQTKRSTPYNGNSNSELAAELERLNLELEALPAVQTYRAAESDVRSFLRAVNAMLSESLKVDFAANAKRGCGCGG